MKDKQLKRVLKALRTKKLFDEIVVEHKPNAYSTIETTIWWVRYTYDGYTVEAWAETESKAREHARNQIKRHLGLPFFPMRNFDATKSESLGSINDCRRKLSSAISTYESAELAVLWLMREYKFNLILLQQALSEEGLKISFSNLKYHSIAELIGLDPLRKLNDIRTFDLHRSRIPTALFKSIIEDMDIMLIQYGPLPEQKTEGTRSRFLSPIFNRLVAEFGFCFRNLPELIIEDRITTKDRIEHYFMAFGSVSVLVVDIKFKIGDLEERLNAIAQVIAECNACDWNNTTQGFNVPVFGILCDGKSFEFFSFNRGTTTTSPPSFTRGCLPGDPPEFRRGLRLSDFTLTGPTRFICELRQICEIIFDLLIRSYLSSLTEFRNRSERRGKKEQRPTNCNGNDLPRWDEALGYAKEAIVKFRGAEGMRSGQFIDDANSTVEKAMKALKLSVALVPIDKTDLIMTGWSDADVERA